MPFVEHIAKAIKISDGYTCQMETCDTPAKSFFPTGTLMHATGLVVANGSWNVQAGHLRERDYHTKFDYNQYNKDGSPRGTTQCTICHAIHEVCLGSHRNSEKLLMGQTIRTFDYIEANGYEDDDIPLRVGKLMRMSQYEIIDLNNRRRNIIKGLLLQRFGTIAISS